MKGCFETLNPYFQGRKRGNKQTVIHEEHACPWVKSAAQFALDSSKPYTIVFRCENHILSPETPAFILFIHCPAIFCLGPTPLLPLHPASQRLSAKPIALVTALMFAGERRVIKAPIFPFDTVCMWSQLMAQSWCMPSCFERKTSLGIFLTVVVMGATVTSPRYCRIESRVRIKTGRFLSGAANLYHRISPRFTRHPRPVHPPTR